MISIIICSINPATLSELEKNIAETIGVPYEIIATDNRTSKQGICKVYNKAATKANFPYLCFIHEDIRFETNNWGYIIARHFKDKTVGLLGVAGGDSKSLVPSSWSIPILSNEINIIQHYKNRKAEAGLITKSGISDRKSLKEVVAVDGVFLCTRRKIFYQFQFDENCLHGFHGYDIDYSLQVGTKYRVCVMHDLLLQHYSDGTPDQNWVDSAMRISKKWKHQLPVSVVKPTPGQLNLHHWHSLRVFLEQLFRLNYSFPFISKVYLTYSFTRFFSIRRFLSMGKYIILMKLQPARRNR
jgi:hypothetical protein